jgi:hypothetical protein
VTPQASLPGLRGGTFVGDGAQKILGPAITGWLKARL